MYGLWSGDLWQAGYDGVADIQIMASNQLQPRSWVSGLYVAAKYMPIRMGRGMWHRKRKVAVPWNEAESYRALVHEWAHYALDLRDAYLEPHAKSIWPTMG